MVNPQTITEHYVSREGGKVYYYMVGYGEPLLLLHGIGYRARELGSRLFGTCDLDHTR